MLWIIVATFALGGALAVWLRVGLGRPIFCPGNLLSSLLTLTFAASVQMVPLENYTLNQVRMWLVAVGFVLGMANLALFVVRETSLVRKDNPGG
jgi:hypothetical protein